MFSRFSLTASAIAMVLVSSVAFSQAAQDPAFDVASVKPNLSGEAAVRVNNEGNRFTAINAPLILLVRLAFAVPEYRIVNAPDWIRTERFDLSASTGTAVNREQQNAMLRTLLRERFKLATRAEVRELPIYALVRDRPDGVLGPNLRPSSTNCPALLAAARTGIPLPAANRILCGVQRRPGGVSVGGMSMGEVAAQLLSAEAGRLVIDRTGLDGAFDFDLEFATGGAPLEAVPIVTALREQLGLRLEPQRGAVDVLVVDHIERPVAD